MALNQAHWNGGVLIHAGEWILLYCDGVELKFDGNSEPSFSGTKKGRLYLTSHRVVFINKDAKDRLQSFSMPFSNLGSVDIDQPLFGANAIKGNVKALPGGNWEGTGQFRITFNHGGAIEFGRAMLQAAKLASRNPPPPYTPPQMDAGNFYHPPPPAYMQANNPDGFQDAKEKFPSAPPAQEVWMTDQPPPYASIYTPQQQPYPAAPAAGAYYNGPSQQQPYLAAAPPAGAYYNGQSNGYQAAPYPSPSVGAVYPNTQYGNYPQAATGPYPSAGYAGGNYNEPPPVYPGLPSGKR